MPTYDYRCAECGHVFEEFQSISAEPLRTCPACKKDTLKRVMGGGAGMIFKGQGFYLTDYKKGGNNSGSGPSKPKKSPEQKKESPPSDSSSSSSPPDPSPKKS